MPDRIRIKRHPESYEVIFPDGRPSRFFYYENDPIRRSFMGRMTSKQAEIAAKTFAGGERDKLES
jgi:hypothetical protein